MAQFKIINEDKEFKFKQLCPYCKGDLTYRCTGWQQDENGQWIADHLDSECSNKPSMDNEEEWEQWLQQHSEMPYVYQLPIDNSVKEFINKKYRFKLIE